VFAEAEEGQRQNEERDGKQADYFVAVARAAARFEFNFAILGGKRIGAMLRCTHQPILRAGLENSDKP
jgi:hypothetical protein